MRRLFVAILLASTALPAFAASRDSDEIKAARIAKQLNDPATQSAMSGMMVAMADMVMDMRVDKLRAAIARIDPDWRDGDDRDSARTIGDVVARDDPYFREHLADGSRKAMGTMGAAAAGMADMMPEFRAMADRMSRQVDEAMRRMPRR